MIRPLWKIPFSVDMINDIIISSSMLSFLAIYHLNPQQRSHLHLHVFYKENFLHFLQRSHLWWGHNGVLCRHHWLCSSLFIQSWLAHAWLVQFHSRAWDDGWWVGLWWMVNVDQILTLMVLEDWEGGGKMRRNAINNWIIHTLTKFYNV